MKVVLGVLLVVHGLIHLVGALPLVSSRAGAAALVPPGVAARTAPLWLVASLAFVFAAALLAAGDARWWVPAAAAAALSQALIADAWSAAKAGTLANLLIVVAIVVALGRSR